MSARRLAAILAADVVGYSRLVSADESDALTRLGALRRDIIEPNIVKHSGRLFKVMGDGFLAEFASAVQAVTCAIAIQTETEQATATLDDSSKMRLRIGVHVGDVMVEGDDLMGDGINIVARLESIAAPGGISISRAVHDQVRDRIDVLFDDKGDIVLKNIARPVHVFAISGRKDAPAKSPPGPQPALALPDKPSIAVLPFQNMSGDPEQEYFADGMVEDIITALSRFKSLFVIARNSSFTYKGKAVDIKQVGRELGVRYVLEGSVRKAGGKVRITGQLIEAATGTHLWADKFDGALDDVFELQDQVTKSVVGAIAPKLQKAEIDRSVRKPTQNLDAYDYYYRGLSRLQLMTPDSNEEALQLFKQAIELDPFFASAYGLASECYRLRQNIGWARNDTNQLSLGKNLALRAVELGQDDAVALACAAHFFGFALHEAETADALVDQALSVNPNLFRAWQTRGWTSIYLGQHERAIVEISHTMRLNPIDPQMHQAEAAMVIALVFLHRSEEALDWIKKALARHPTYPPTLRFATVAYTELNRLDEARSMLARLRKIDPDMRVSQLKTWLPFQRSEDTAIYIDGMRKAGMPE